MEPLRKRVCIFKYVVKLSHLLWGSLYQFNFCLPTVHEHTYSCAFEILLFFFLAVLGLRCCAGFSLVVSGGLLFVTVCGLPLAGLVLLGSTGFRVCGLSSCRSQALEHRLLVAVGRLSCSLDVGSYRTRDWPGSSALAGGSLPPSHQGSPEIFTLKIIHFIIVPPCIMYHLSIYYLKKCSGNKRIARGVKLTELIEVLIIQARS